MAMAGLAQLRFLGRRATVAVIAAGALAAGCGSDDSSPATGGGDRAQLEAVMDQFRRALADGDGTLGCEALAEKFRRQLSAGLVATTGKPVATPDESCQVAFERLAAAPITEDLTPKILRVRVTGDKAKVDGFVSHMKERQTATFVREGDEWKLVEWFRGAR